MPAQSEVSICNLALTTLSTSRISDLDEDSENARKCNAVYSYVRDNLMSQRNWNFATAEASLASVDATPVLGDWSNVYQIPTNCLRVIRQEGDYDFKIFDSKLYSNEATCKIQYIERITDAGAFPAYFANALAAEIAAVLAYGITQNATLAAGIRKYSKGLLDEAVWSDSQEGVGNRAIRSSFITARQVRTGGEA